VSLIDLTRQTDVQWDARKTPGGEVEDVTLSFERVTSRPPRVFAASPAAPSARELEPTLVDGYDVVRVPAWATWTLVWADLS
jgi:hypothetical protein